MKRFLPLLLLATLTACENKPPPSEPSRQPNGLSIFPSPPRDAVPEPKLLVSLSVYRISVPAKSISHNEQFWKHVNEDSPVNVAAHELLLLNGFRVGVAPRGDWDYFKNILEANPVISQITRSASVEATSFELPLKQNVLDQFIFYFHPENGLVGQKYDRCDDSMLIRFEPTPKMPGHVRVTVTPRLLSQRTEVIYTVRNQPQELSFQHPEHLFDMKLSVDVPLNQFLIIAPSTQADESSSLGRKFLYHESNGQEFENLLIITPQPFQLDEKKPATGPTTAPASAR